MRRPVRGQLLPPVGLFVQNARSVNPYSVGVEHEGYADDPAWSTDAVSRSSAALTRHLTDKYGIPKDCAAGTPFPTWGTDVSVRQRPTTDSARVATLPGPTSVRVACQVHGGLVEYDGYSNDASSYLPDHGGYVSNIVIDVDDAWLPGVPTC
ncbi:hypothetical protein RKD38_000523 [Streptomyces ambofaciens]|jgi:hypothetical protein